VQTVGPAGPGALAEWGGGAGCLAAVAVAGGWGAVVACGGMAAPWPVRLWDARRWACIATLTGHAGPLRALVPISLPPAGTGGDGGATHLARYAGPAAAAAVAAARTPAALCLTAL
jgi:hypothetical protein